MTKYVEVNDFISHITRVINFNKIYENLYRVGLNKEQKKVSSSSGILFCRKMGSPKFVNKGNQLVYEVSTFYTVDLVMFSLLLTENIKFYCTPE